nr:N-6 DNA methylase [Pseudomonadota bacterium]
MLLNALGDFGAELTRKFRTPAAFSPEDQLKTPLEALLRAAAAALELDIGVVSEVQERTLGGRPDLGVSVGGLLAGYIELKAPGKGADPARFKGADKAQWEKFRNLPNLLYTDGNDWSLYRDGERVGKRVRLAGDVTADGRNAANAEDADALLELLRNFLYWHPVAPATPRALAELLAPLCRLLRADVFEAVNKLGSNMDSLAVDWRRYLFPEGDNWQFADAYAQTLTYALLLARLSGTVEVTAERAVKTLRKGHRLLAETLKILADDKARGEIEVPVSLLERVIAAVDAAALARPGADPWLYFYEDFLAAYDPKMRKDRGVYYTPVPVVQAQVRLVAELLETRFDAEFNFVDDKVVTLDPAAGTGTYILAALEHGLEKIAAAKGQGMRAAAATRGARNLHAFEILVGPYAVAHLRLTEQVLAEGGALPADGAHVYLADTLESPHAEPPGHLPLPYREMGEEHKRAQKVKAETPVLVCIGNPPYDRQTIDVDATVWESRKGGWVRYGDEHKEGAGILKDFIEPLIPRRLGLHAKNLYNDYVYFWRWALWKVFEHPPGPGIVSFITASSYLLGPGFAGMRLVMRQTFDELWIIDLEGGSLGARKTENVFAIRTPVAIAIGARYAAPRPDTPAAVRYARIGGGQEAKLEQLAAITGFAGLAWRACPDGWTAPFLPLADSAYQRWPLLTDVFPWQENGVQFKRTWPIGETVELLERRWRALLAAKDKKAAFRETEARTAADRYPALHDRATK